MIKSLFFLLLILQLSVSFAQSLVDDADLETNSSSQTFTETIKIISETKKIFILTNNNQLLNQGDFVSLILDNQLAARALVAKTYQGQAGIKILKIYSLSQWKKLGKDKDVQLIRGDDSQFNKKVTTDQKADDSKVKIKDEEDLYSKDVVIDDEGDFESNSKRHLKPDNLVAIGVGFKDVNQAQPESGKIRGTEISLSWAYQFNDNYFLEGAYGRTQFNNFPGENITSVLNRFSLRLKYNIKGPAYTFFLPYVGFQTVSVSSPNAAKTNNSQTNDFQTEALNNLKKSGPVAGITVLRRLVPGWFVKADLGTDMMNLGFAIEF